MKRRVFRKIIRNAFIFMLLIVGATAVGYGYGAHQAKEACLKWRVTKASCQQHIIDAQQEWLRNDVFVRQCMKLFFDETVPLRVKK